MHLTGTSFEATKIFSRLCFTEVELLDGNRKMTVILTEKGEVIGWTDFGENGVLLSCAYDGQNYHSSFFGLTDAVTLCRPCLFRPRSVKLAMGA